ARQQRDPDGGAARRHVGRHLRAAADDRRGRRRRALGRALGRRSAPARRGRRRRAAQRARSVQADAAPDRRAQPAASRPVEQADRARARSLGRDHQGPRRRGAARARRQLAHAGGARRQPALEPGNGGAVALAAAALSAPGGASTLAPAAAADGDAPDAAGAAPLDSFLLLRDRVRGTFAYNGTTLAGHAVGAILIEMVFADAAPRMLRVVWGVAFAIVWLARAWLVLRFARNEPTTIAGLESRLRAWQAGVLTSGVLWGAAAWFYSAYGSGLHQLALVLVVYTFCVACVPILRRNFACSFSSSCSSSFR